MEYSKTDLPRVPFLKHLAAIDSFSYEGEPEPHIRKFLAGSGAGERMILAAQVIAKEEGLLWESCRDLFAHALSLAAEKIQGTFHYQLLSLEIGQEGLSFNPSDFAALLANHAGKIQPGDGRFIRYGTAFGMLKKAVSGGRGKVIFGHGVIVFSDSLEKLDLFLKKILQFVPPTGPKADVVVDVLGNLPLFDPLNAEQGNRLGRFFLRRKEFLRDRVGDIRIIQKGAGVELLDFFGTRARNAPDPG